MTNRATGWTRAGFAGALLAVGALGVSAPAEAQRKPPYWASVSAGQARMRTGPGRNYPASWLYQRADLPVKVVDVYQSWRKVEDPDGTQGWMLVNLLSDRRTAMIRGSVLPLRDGPSDDARVLWRAEPGVVARVTTCASGWCRIDVRGRAGYARTSGLWGVDLDEAM